MCMQEFKIFLQGILRTPGLHRLVSATYSSSEGMPKRKSTRVAEVATKKAKLAEPSLKFDLQWQQEGEDEKGLPQLVMLDGPGALCSSKAAGFDIDWTIIKTKSGRKFPSGPKDWEFLYDCVPAKLKELHDGGTKVVFFTNQAGIEKQKVTVKELSAKFEDIINAVGVPIQVFVCTGNSHYRKPSVEMWRFMEAHCNGGVKISREASLYVGDAAGRAKGWAPGKSKDFSSADRMFAANIGVQFHTPEGFFLGEPEAAFEWRSFDPRAYLKSISTLKPPQQLHSDSQELMLIVGRSASGKSTLQERYFTPHGYTTVSRDTLGTQEKCLKATASALKSGKSVVIDNTNPSKEVRKPYVDLAKGTKVPVRCIYLDMPADLSSHLNYFRQNQSKGTKRRVPAVGYRVFEKNFQLPEASEGFTEVRRMEFVPQFDSDADRELFQHWTSADL